MDTIENNQSANEPENISNQNAPCTSKPLAHSSSPCAEWYEIEEPDVQWLVTGLITSDGYAAICGKPKAGKSCLVRNLAVCVVTGQEFLGRTVELPANTGRVLYLHLDRKDRKWRVARQFRELGIVNSEQASRLRLLTDENLPADPSDRGKWLTHHIAEFRPDLVVIDLLWQFLEVPSANDYKEVLTGINALQDALRHVGYKGATVVTMHARKAVSQDNPADDILGSTAQRGSFGTMIVLSRDRRRGLYTIISDQTDRDDCIGEIEESAIIRTEDGTLQLGQLVCELNAQQASQEMEREIQHLLLFLEQHPACDMEVITSELRISKSHALKLLRELDGMIQCKGQGVKGDPFRYSLASQG